MTGSSSLIQFPDGLALKAENLVDEELLSDRILSLPEDHPVRLLATLDHLENVYLGDRHHWQLSDFEFDLYKTIWDKAGIVIDEIIKSPSLINETVYCGYEWKLVQRLACLYHGEFAHTYALELDALNQHRKKLYQAIQDCDMRQIAAYSVKPKPANPFTLPVKGQIRELCVALQNYGCEILAANNGRLGWSPSTPNVVFRSSLETSRSIHEMLSAPVLKKPFSTFWELQGSFKSSFSEGSSYVAWKLKPHYVRIDSFSFRALNGLRSDMLRLAASIKNKTA